MRIGGEHALDDAKAGKDGGFKGRGIRRGRQAAEAACRAEAVPAGYLGATFPAMLRPFGDGQGAMILSFAGSLCASGACGGRRQGDRAGRSRACSPSPVSPAARASPPTPWAASTPGWCHATRRRRPIAFLNLLTSLKYQTATAATRHLHALGSGRQLGHHGSAAAAPAAELAKSTYHQNYFDQDLGPDVGRVLNDVTTALAAGRSPRKVWPSRSRRRGTSLVEPRRPGPAHFGRRGADARAASRNGVSEHRAGAGALPATGGAAVHRVGRRADLQAGGTASSTGAATDCRPFRRLAQFRADLALSGVPPGAVQQPADHRRLARHPVADGARRWPRWSAGRIGAR